MTRKANKRKKAAESQPSSADAVPPASTAPDGATGRGRPRKYRAEFAKQARKLCELGATDRDLAEFFDVTTVTIWRWRSQHREFCNALKVGKGAPDDRVEFSLYQRAVGQVGHALVAHCLATPFAAIGNVLMRPWSARTCS
jgi:hypothetical protein